MICTSGSGRQVANRRQPGPVVRLKELELERHVVVVEPEAADGRLDALIVDQVADGRLEAGRAGEGRRRERPARRGRWTRVTDDPVPGPHGVFQIVPDPGGAGAAGLVQEGEAGR